MAAPNISGYGLRVEVAIMDTPASDPPTSWVDLSERVIAVSDSRGVSGLQGAQSPATIDITLDNEDGALNPADGVFAQYGLPGSPVRVTITEDGGPDRPWFYGFLDDDLWGNSHDPSFGHVATITATDKRGTLASYELPSTAWEAVVQEQGPNIWIRDLGADGEINGARFPDSSPSHYLMEVIAGVSYGLEATGPILDGSDHGAIAFRSRNTGDVFARSGGITMADNSTPVTTGRVQIGFLWSPITELTGRHRLAAVSDAGVARPLLAVDATPDGRILVAVFSKLYGGIYVGELEADLGEPFEEDEVYQVWAGVDLDGNQVSVSVAGPEETEASDTLLSSSLPNEIGTTGLRVAFGAGGHPQFGMVPDIGGIGGPPVPAVGGDVIISEMVAEWHPSPEMVIPSAVDGRAYFGAEVLDRIQLAHRAVGLPEPDASQVHLGTGGPVTDHQLEQRIGSLGGTVASLIEDIAASTGGGTWWARRDGKLDIRTRRYYDDLTPYSITHDLTDLDAPAPGCVAVRRSRPHLTGRRSESIVTTARVTHERTGSLIVRKDFDAMGAFGERRRDVRSLAEDVEEAVAAAEYILADHATPIVGVESVTLEPFTDEGVLAFVLDDLEIGLPVFVTWTDPVGRIYRMETAVGGWSTDWRDGSHWTVRLVLSPLPGMSTAATDITPPAPLALGAPSPPVSPLQAYIEGNSSTA